MKTYAVLDSGNNVVNVIVAGSLEIAETITNSICVAVTDITGSPHIGLSYSDGVFEQPETIMVEAGTEEPI